MTAHPTTQQREAAATPPSATVATTQGHAQAAPRQEPRRSSPLITSGCNHVVRC
jgi:hypothetical protein